MKITEDIRYIGVDDHAIDLFEGQFVVPQGMSYNSYLIMDDKIAVLDTVDAHYWHDWMDKLQKELDGKTPDYLIVSHMEPDHSANIANFIKSYPGVKVVATAKAFDMMSQFFNNDYADNRLIVGEGDTLSLGSHTLSFLSAAMVHWPEVMVTYDNLDKALFSADAFGKFGAVDTREAWDDEARRYYFGIVGKYGSQVQTLLKKVAALDIQIICPLHGPVLCENLEHYLALYDTWSSYTAESEGVFIAFSSVYGNTKRAVDNLAEKLRAQGCPKIIVSDLAREYMSKAVENAFRYNKLVLATTTYNADLFPAMRNFIEQLCERGYKNRTLAIIENGSWSPRAAKAIKELFEKSKNLNILSPVVSIKSSLRAESREQLDALAGELCSDYAAQNKDGINKHDRAALSNIAYGLYFMSSNDGTKDNALITNSVVQVTNNPKRIAVTLNKDNYSHHVIKNSGMMNLCCLSTATPLKIFESFGFVSGRNVDKLKDYPTLRSDNGLVYLPEYINSYMSLEVEQYIDLDTHGMFICSVTEARVINDEETMTYDYYQKHVKPKPKARGKKGFVCKICGYIYEGDELPEDFICPLCNHGAADFEPIE